MHTSTSCTGRARLGSLACTVHCTRMSRLFPSRQTDDPRNAASAHACPELANAQSIGSRIGYGSHGSRHIQGCGATDFLCWKTQSLCQLGCVEEAAVFQSSSDGNAAKAVLARNKYPSRARMQHLPATHSDQPIYCGSAFVRAYEESLLAAIDTNSDCIHPQPVRLHTERSAQPPAP